MVDSTSLDNGLDSKLLARLMPETTELTDELNDGIVEAALVVATMKGGVASGKLVQCEISMVLLFFWI